MLHVTDDKASVFCCKPWKMRHRDPGLGPQGQVLLLTFNWANRRQKYLLNAKVCFPNVSMIQLKANGDSNKQFEIGRECNYLIEFLLRDGRIISYREFLVALSFSFAPVGLSLSSKVASPLV